MRTTQGKLESSVIQRLIDEPHRFKFVQALRMVLLLLRKSGVPYDKAFTHVLRFQNSLRLSFPASELEALRAGGDVEARTDTMLRLALQQDEQMQICITPAFIGFLGTCGVLPYHYSERMANMLQQDKDAGARAFVDMFSNRIVGLFFQAWEKYRLEQRLDTKGEDALLPIMLALSGVTDDVFAAPDRSRNMGGVTDHVAAYYAALFRTRPVSAHTIKNVLSEYFGVPIRVEEFVGSWDPIPKDKRSTLGGPNPKLGYGAVLGTRLWRRDRRVRLHIGPLDKPDLERFLPRGDAAAALEKMLELFGVGNLEFEVRLILGPSCIQPLTLTSRNRPAMRRLGWDTFLSSSTGQVSRPEVRYMLHPK